MVGVAMSETEKGEAEGGFINSILNPGRTISIWFFALGAWILLVGILNVLVMAHPTGKISWISFLSLGTFGQILDTETSNQGFSVLSDGAFLTMGLVLIGLGAKGINTHFEGGMAAWLKNLFLNDYWLAMMNAEEGGWRKTFSSWLLAIGIIFYFYWGIAHTGWIDPGVYSVAAALIGFGIALSIMPTEDGEVAPMD
jgi:peptidoglycan/LPS O-acetylase OafA/YrhL